MKRLIAVLALAGCAPPPPPGFSAPQLQMPRGRDFFLSPHASDHSRAPTPNASGNNILYLNYDGITLSYNVTDNAPTNVSQLDPVSAVPPFALWPNAKVTLQQAKDSVTDRLRGFYKPFDLQIVTTRPAAGPYTMIAVGGKNTIISNLTGAAGVSPLDCDARTQTGNPNNVVYDFSDEQPPDYGGLPAIAITAAHESGHSYGLEHTDFPSDIMYSVASPNITIDDVFGAAFKTGNYSSFNGGGEVGRCSPPVDPLDNVALLTAALGSNPSPGDITPPTISLTFPLLQQVPTQFPVRVTAADNIAVKRVEVYKNLELIAVLNAAPYQTVVTAADNESFYLTVEAIDADANSARVTQAFLAASATPPLCPNGDSDCKSGSGQVCKMGICRYPFGTPCTGAQECEYLCQQPQGVAQMICTNTCNGARPCPTGFQCAPDSYCVAGTGPMLKVLGSSCGAPEECASMRCQDTCVAACDDTTPCADGMTCAMVGGGQGCVMAQPSPAPASGGCEVAPHPVGAPLFILLFVAWFAARRWWRRAV